MGICPSVNKIACTTGDFQGLLVAIIGHHIGSCEREDGQQDLDKSVPDFDEFDINVVLGLSHTQSWRELVAILDQVKTVSKSTEVGRKEGPK